MKNSFIIRTYNEARHLGEVVEAIQSQEGYEASQNEIIIVDSGSTDNTLDIATKYNCRVVHIEKEDFTFGRSLNLGCDAAKGENLIILSGHCIPTSTRWLINLCKTLEEKDCVYGYGRQVGRNGVTRFSEQRVFLKNYPLNNAEQLGGIFCNNANSIVIKSAWEKAPFNETLTGLEDMAAAQKFMEQGYRIGYAEDATVEHIHHENWRQVQTRYEREAYALHHILPEIQVSLADTIRYTASSIFFDLKAAFQRKVMFSCALEIILYRVNQFWGTYKGHNDHRKLSHERKEQYFYPK